MSEAVVEQDQDYGLRRYKKEVIAACASTT